MESQFLESEEFQAHRKLNEAKLKLLKKLKNIDTLSKFKKQMFNNQNNKKKEMNTQHGMLKNKQNNY